MVTIREVTEPTAAPPIFYSSLSRAVEAIPQPKAQPSQWINMIRNLQAKGIRQAEIDWTGIIPWLEQQAAAQTPVSKPQILDYLQQHQLNIGTTVHGTERDFVKPDAQAGIDHGPAWDQLVQQTRALKAIQPPISDPAYEDWVKQDHAVYDQMDALHARMVDDSMARQQFSGKPGKYKSYRLPGGQDYREMLLTTPPTNDKTTDYRTKHWSEPNVLAHTRFDTRTDIHGNQTLHIAEIQSDWHQEGRRQGYRDDPVKLDWRMHVTYRGTPKPHLIHAFNGDKEVGAIEDQGQYGWRAYDQDGVLSDHGSEAEAKAALQQHLEDTHGVPAAPFKKEWPNLALKRILRQAVDNGFDRITWDVGLIHAQRYALSNHISDITLYGVGDKLQVSATDLHNQKVMDKQHTTREGLTALIGKDATDKILAQPEPDLTNPYAARSLHGLDLNIGGEGMQGFYDQILPALANKYTKKWGGRVTQTQVATTEEQQASPAWELIISPQMKQAIAQGQPLWESYENR